MHGVLSQTLAGPCAVAGKNYGNSANGGVFIGSNTYITFGEGSTVYSGISSSTPALPAIHIGSGDNSWKAVWAGPSAGCHRCVHSVDGSRTVLHLYYTCTTF